MIAKIQFIFTLICIGVVVFFIWSYKQQQSKIEDLQTKLSKLPPGVTKTVTIEKNTIKTVYKDKITGEIKTNSTYVPPEGKINIVYKEDKESEEKYKQTLKEKLLLEQQKLESQSKLSSYSQLILNKEKELQTLLSENTSSTDSTLADNIKIKQQELDELKILLNEQQLKETEYSNTINVKDKEIQLNPK